MKRFKSAKPIDAAHIRKIKGSFSWIDHRFIPMMEGLSRNENLLYLWLVAVGDRLGLSFYSDEKTSSRLKITVSEISEARTGLIDKKLITYRDGVSQVLSLPIYNEEAFHGGGHDNERGVCRAGQISEGCPESVAEADRDRNRHLSKQIVQDILRQLK